jgi:hypothetical protein
MSHRTTVSIVLAAVLSGVAGLLGSPAAHAQGDGVRPAPWEFVPTGFPATLDAGVACDFPVTFDEVANQEYSRTLPNGTTVVNGQLVVRVTNDVSETSVVRTVSGPIFMSTGPNGEQVVTARGNTLSPVFAGNDATGTVGRGLFVFHGTIVFTDFILTTFTGSYEDLCKALA